MAIRNTVATVSPRRSRLVTSDKRLTDAEPHPTILLDIHPALYMMCCFDFAIGPAVLSKRFFASAVRRARAMRIRKRNSGSAATAALLSLIIVVLVVVTVYVFASNLPWAVRPAPITAVGAEIDHQYDLTLAVTGTVFILSQLGLAFAIFRFRDRGQKAHFTRGNVAMEVLWTSITLVVFLGLAIAGRQA